MAGKDQFDKQHDKDLARLKAKIDYLYSQFAKEVAQLSNLIEAGGGIPADKPFSLSDYPATEARLKKLIKKLSKELNINIVNGVRSQWTLANKKNDELCNVVFGSLIDTLTKEQRRYYYTNNGPALAAFLTRKTNGLNLSQQVWNYVDESRGMIESTLELGIKTGESAAEMARDLKQYLKFPDKLFRRVRDNEGNLHLSKNAAAFHPGQGVYRSSYKNAMRLAGTETNMAYRTADHLRHAQLDFVVGIEIHLSNNHTCLDSKGRPQPFYDICDELKGKYPKWFNFEGWHPQCRCFVTTILKTPEELKRDADGIDRGSVNEVKELPKQWEEWLQRNRERIDRAEARGKLPYFLRDNEWAWKDDVEMPGGHTSAQQQAIIRHASRTPEQIEDIKRRWNQRQTAYDDARRVLSLVDSVPDLLDYWRRYDSDALDEYEKLKNRYETGKFKSYGGLRLSAAEVLQNMKLLRDKYSLLDNPFKVMQKWGIEKTREIYDNVRRTMNRYAGLSDSEKAAKYRFEANWIEEHRKGTIPTWKEAQDAYLKAARELEWQIEWGDAKKELDAFTSNPLASPELVEKARALFGKDKAGFEAAIQEVREQIEVDSLITEVDGFKLQYKKLLKALFELEDLAGAIASRNKSQLELIKKLAEHMIELFEDQKAEAMKLLSEKSVSESTKQELREAIDNQISGPLIRAIEKAQKERDMAAYREKASSYLNDKANRAILTSADPRIIGRLEDIVNGKTTDADYAGLTVHRAADILSDWDKLTDEFDNEYRNYVTKSSAYLALLDEAIEAVVTYDYVSLPGLLIRLEAEKKRLEEEKARRKAISEEWDKMSGVVDKIKSANSVDAELRSLISSYEDARRAGTIKAGRDSYGLIVARATALGIDTGLGAASLQDVLARYGSNAPKTLVNLQSEIDKKRAEMLKRNPDLAGKEEEIKRRLLEIFENADLGMNVPFHGRDGGEAVNAIFQSYFKSQIETGTGNGCVDDGTRRRASKELFGTDIKSAVPKDYEKYGFLMSKDILAQADSGIADNYWYDKWTHDNRCGIQVRFKKDRVTATFTMCDSLGSNRIPSLTTDPQITSGRDYHWDDLTEDTLITDPIRATHQYSSGYIELQYHGDLTVDCIDSVFVQHQYFGRFAQASLDVMKEHGIKLYTQIAGDLYEYNFMLKRFESVNKVPKLYWDDAAQKFRPV